jgi:hypothetical protein
MTIRTTSWSPDTCNCTLEYTWDDAVPEDQRTHTPANIVRRCSAHTPLADTNSVFNTIMEENPRKNRSFDEILQNAPNTNWFDIDAESGQRVFKKNIILNWNWTGTAPNRVLTLTFSGITLTTAQRNTLQTRLNTRFGSGKVILG